jgi:hypothetical protein
MRWSKLKSSCFCNFIEFYCFHICCLWLNDEIPRIFLKYYPKCVSILYKKYCRVVLLTKRTFFTIVFFCKLFRTLHFALAWPFLPFFYKRSYNKKLTDLNRSGSTGKYPTSVLLCWPRYRSVNTARPRLDIFPYCPHALSVSKLLILHVNLTIHATNAAWCTEIYPAKSWAWHRNCFNNIRSLYIRQQKYLNSTGNYFQNPLHLAILFIHTCYKRQFLSAQLL